MKLLFKGKKHGKKGQQHYQNTHTKENGNNLYYKIIRKNNITIGNNINIIADYAVDISDSEIGKFLSD